MSTAANIAWMKLRFPLWGSFCLTNGSEDSVVLGYDMDDALNQMIEYIPTLTEDLITASLKSHWVNLTRYRSMNRTHSDTEFDHKPTFIRDYEYSLDVLKRYASGEIAFDAETDENAVDPPDHEYVNIHSKVRRFGSWFTNEGEGN